MTSIVASSLLVVSFLIMTAFGRKRSIYGIGLIGSILHLLGTIRWQTSHENFLFVDLTGVALMSVTAFWTQNDAMKRRHP